MARTIKMDPPIGEVYEAQINGRHMSPGTEFSVRGERGRFRFKCARVDEHGALRWITGIGGPAGHKTFRSFGPDRTFVVHHVDKIRPT